MANSFQCDIVSAEHSIFSGDVVFMVVTGNMGEIGIAPGHAPLLTDLLPGPVRLDMADGTEEIFYVSGGFLEVQPKTVTLLADTAARANDVDEAAARKALDDAQRSMANQDAEFEYSAAAAQLAEAAAQLRALRQLRKERS